MILGSNTIGSIELGGILPVEFYPVTELPASLDTSGYKWLSQTLYAAQQQYVVRPAFTVQIIDDSILPISFPDTSQPPIKRGAAATTPDGYIVAAGLDASNHVVFYKTRDLSQGWQQVMTLDTHPGIAATYANNQISIAVSDWINGSYRIDVIYFINFGGLDGYGANLEMGHSYSNDGGATWTVGISDISDYAMPWADYNVSTPPNLYLALMKPRLVSGSIVTSFLYLFHETGSNMGSGYKTYHLLYSLGLSQGAWGANIDSGDWTIHSFDSFYLNGIDYIIFSGFRNVIDTPSAASANQTPNYSLWITALLKRSITTIPSDVWLPPVQILAADAASNTNQNQFIYPKASVQNGIVDIVFQAVTVDSIAPSAQGATSSTVTTNTNYMLIRSKDGINFSYPQILVDSLSSEIIPYDNLSQLLSFVAQDNYYYICGGHQTIQFIYNNIVADVSADVIGYQIQESAGQPSSINLNLANQDNKWVGSAPTAPGAAAIKRNAKVALWQGYFTSEAIPEYVPRNVYYIDDINQEVSGKQNDLAIVGRDFFKKLKTLVTRYSFQQVGPYFYTDVFDGTTLGNWTQQAGSSWEEIDNLLQITADNAGDNIITYGRSAQIPFGSVMVVNVELVAGASAYIYAFYIDSTHYLRLNLNGLSGGVANWAIEVCFGSYGITVIDSGTLSWGGTGFLSFYVRQYDYYKWNFLYTATTPFAGGNPLATWNYAELLKNSTTGEIDLRANPFISNSEFQQPWTVGLGCKDKVVPFGYFRYSQFGPITNILSCTQSLATRAGVFDTVVEKMFEETMINPSFVGTYLNENHRLVLEPSQQAINDDPNITIGNGELIFTAKVIPVATGGGQSFGFYLVFRSDDTVPTNCYRLFIRQYVDGNGFISVRFERVYSAIPYIFPNTSNDDQIHTPGTTQLGSINFDITKYHEYRITMVDGWFYAYIDGIMVGAWNDNNTTASYLIDGYWGFQSLNSNSEIVIKDIYSPIFWKPVQAFSFNPGDDAENAIETLIQSLRGWMFSDMFGRMKLILLSPFDQSTYTYNNQLWQQNVDQSDKEYFSQVTVYGTGVMATARNTDLMAGVPVRDEVIVDYTIMTESDAQVRANNELINANLYLNQFFPKQIINLGSELFDSITVINTGNNTTQIDSGSRIYTQSFNEGGGNNASDYSISVQTGNL